MGPVGYKQHGLRVGRVRGTGRALGLGLLQYLRAATGVKPTALGPRPGLRALRRVCVSGGGAELTLSSCPARGLESASDPRTSSRIQGRRTRPPKLAIPAAGARMQPLARVFPVRRGPASPLEGKRRPSGRDERSRPRPGACPRVRTRASWSGTRFNWIPSCLRLPEHLSKQRRGVGAVLQVSCGAGQEGAKNWL